MISGILIAAVIVGGTGLFIGIFLGLSEKKFAIEVDEREAAILNVLPGNNCGGCGYAGCSGLAAAIVNGEAEIGGCPVGGSAVAAQIGEIMGVSADAQDKKVAFVKCGGTCGTAINEYEYQGIEDCKMAALMQDGGPKGCAYGCLGFGSCVKACPFEAISMEHNLAYIDPHKCRLCRKCEDVCPQGAIAALHFPPRKPREAQPVKEVSEMEA